MKRYTRGTRVPVSPASADASEAFSTAGAENATRKLTQVKRTVVPLAMKLWIPFLPFTTSLRHLTSTRQSTSDNSSKTSSNSKAADHQWKRRQTKHSIKVHKFLSTDQREIYARITFKGRQNSRGHNHKQRRKHQQQRENSSLLDTGETNSTVEEASSSLWDEEDEYGHDEQQPEEAEAAEAAEAAAEVPVQERVIPSTTRTGTTRPLARLRLGRRANWKFLTKDRSQMQDYLDSKEFVTEHKHHIQAQRNTLRTLRVTSKALHRPMRRSFVQAQDSVRDYIMFSVIPEVQAHVDVDTIVEEEEEEQEEEEDKIPLAREAESDHECHDPIDVGC